MMFDRLVFIDTLLRHGTLRASQFGFPFFVQDEHAREIAQHGLKLEMLQTALKDQTKDAEAANRKTIRLQASLDQQEVMLHQND